MTDDFKKSEKSIDNLLFSSDDENDIFDNDFKTKNIVNNHKTIDNNDLTNQIGHTSKSKRIFSYQIDNFISNDDDDLINCRDQFSKFFNLN